MNYFMDLIMLLGQTYQLFISTYILINQLLIQPNWQVVLPAIGCQDISYGIRDMKYVRTLVWYIVIISYIVCIIFDLRKIHKLIKS